MKKLINDLKNRERNVLVQKSTMKSAVMIPLIEKDNELYILFEVRSKNLKKQPGEICFPGGKVDKTDTNEEETARRELCEELGLSMEEIETIAPLDVLVTPFRGVIYPFVGEIKTPEFISPNKEEVEEIFLVPLTFLLENKPKTYEMNIHFEPDKDFPFHLIPNEKSYQKRTQRLTEIFYFYNNYVIWGLTAKILTHFLELVKETGSFES